MNNLVMKIAIQAADLDAKRIDGTRVYIKNVLHHLGGMQPQDDFYIYHRGKFNSELAPPKRENYHVQQLKKFPLWTQSRFALELLRKSHDVLWMPMQSLPLIRPSKLKTVVTIHDLAFRFFPDHFPASDRRKLNILTRLAIEKSDRIIAVSHNTKKDILCLYPKVQEEKIRVIHHGFDKDYFSRDIDDIYAQSVLDEYDLKASRYILYVGALQPRKNLCRLIKAFNELKKDEYNADLKLLLAGERAWLWKGVEAEIQKSSYAQDIVVTGTIPFDHVRLLYSCADVFVFPSLYEGFGLPILEAFASGVPVVCAHNSSLPEVGGDGPLYFDAHSVVDLAKKIAEVLIHESVRSACIQKGRDRLRKFSWEKCARETIDQMNF